MAYLRRLILVGLGGCGALLVFALVGLVAGRIWIYKIYWIPQNGMYPTLPQGTFCLAWRRPYGSVTEVARGDVVVFEEVKEGRRYSVVWRVVGLPGDIVETGSERVRVNGRSLRQEPVKSEGKYRIVRESSSYLVANEIQGAEHPPVEVEVPPGYLFVMGDNRAHSYDSEAYGPIPFDSVVGRVFWWLEPG